NHIDLIEELLKAVTEALAYHVSIGVVLAANRRTEFEKGLKAGTIVACPRRISCDMSGGGLRRTERGPRTQARLDVRQLDLEDARTDSFEIANRAGDRSCDIAGSSCDVLFINTNTNLVRAGVDSGGVVTQGCIA